MIATLLLMGTSALVIFLFFPGSFMIIFSHWTMFNKNPILSDRWSLYLLPNGDIAVYDKQYPNKRILAQLDDGSVINYYHINE